MSGAPLLPAIPARLGLAARAVYVSAVRLAAGAAPPDGAVPGGMHALAEDTGLTIRQVRRNVQQLEEHRLVARRGYTTRARIVVVDLRTLMSEAASPGSGGQDFRELRARVGGLQRALTEIQGQRDAAKAEADELRRNRRLAANSSLVGLLADLAHTTDCPTPLTCSRCEAIARRVETKRAEYVAEAELVERLEHADLVASAGEALLESMRDRGVGAMQRRADAARAFAKAIGGELRPGG